MLLAAVSARGALAQPPLVVPEEARAGLELLYQGDTQRATALFRTLQAQRPDHPLGYLLEANAVWWERWCGTLELEPSGLIDVPIGPASPLDTLYQSLVAAAQQRAPPRSLPAPAYRTGRQAGFGVAEAHLYAGLAYAMEGRLRALRGENRAAASAGRKMRAALLRAWQLNPQLDDALFGLGLYNYYVATLSPLVQLLRVLLFIPGGDKATGIQQLERAAERGLLTSAEARFWLAKNLRNYDQDYVRARAEFERLSQRYPQNPIFALLLADVEAKLGNSAATARAYTRARDLARGDSPCARRVAELAARGLQQLPPPPTR